MPKSDLASEVRRLYAMGVPTYQIAETLNLSEHEVDRLLGRL